MLKVFLVEDSAPIRERMIAMIASIAGALLVGQASDVAGAVKDILSTAPDVVVLDIKLDNDGSGLDVLRAIKAAGSPAEVYMLSNFDTPAHRQAAARLGAKGFFDKSHEFERLKETLATLASRYGSLAAR